MESVEADQPTATKRRPFCSASRRRISPERPDRPFLPARATAAAAPVSAGRHPSTPCRSWLRRSTPGCPKWTSPATRFRRWTAASHRPTPKIWRTKSRNCWLNGQFVRFMSAYRCFYLEALNVSLKTGRNATFSCALIRQDFLLPCSN